CGESLGSRETGGDAGDSVHDGSPLSDGGGCASEDAVELGPHGAGVSLLVGLGPGRLVEGLLVAGLVDLRLGGLGLGPSAELLARESRHLGVLRLMLRRRAAGGALLLLLEELGEAVGGLVKLAEGVPLELAGV